MRLGDLEQAKLRERFQRCLGAGLSHLLAQSDVTDVLVNADGQVWIKRVGAGLETIELVLEASTVLALIKTTAALVGSLVNDEHPILEARVPGAGWRFEALLPPVVEAPVLAVRKLSPTVYALSRYVETGGMSRAVYDGLREAVRARKNVLVIGGTGSGKTTLVNALLQEVALQDPNERPVIIEDTPELQCPCAGAVKLQACGSISMARLLQATLRLFPSRIVVGEIRGAEALVLVNAWNTGHGGGVCTVHANNARAGLVKLEQMAQQGAPGGVSRHQVALAVHTLVFIAERHGKRRVEELVHVRGLSTDGNYEFGEVVT